MCPPPPATPDLPPELGVRLTAEGAQFSVYAGHARSVEVCLFDQADDGTTTERRVPLRHRAHGTWFDTVPGVGAGQRYAFRVDGEWDPDRSLLHNPAKLLLDPYARAIEGEVRLDPALYAHRVGPDLRGDLWVRDDRDSAPHMPRCVIVEDEFDWGADEFPTTLAHRVAHLRGARQERDEAAPRRPRGAPRHVCRPGPPRLRRPPARAGCHRRRAAAGAHLHARARPRAARADEPLGLQHARASSRRTRRTRRRPTRRAPSTSSRRWSRTCTPPASRCCSTSSTTTRPRTPAST